MAITLRRGTQLEEPRPKNKNEVVVKKKKKEEELPIKASDDASINKGQSSNDDDTHPSPKVICSTHSNSRMCKDEEAQ